MRSTPCRWLALAFILALLPSFASAADDVFLKLTAADGTSRVVRCVAGACVVKDLAPGSYTVRVCDAQGNDTATALDIEYAVVSPRDASSGLPTGKRQHQPMRVTPSPDAGATSRIEVPATGSELSIQVPSLLRAQDHNSSRSNKTSR